MLTALAQWEEFWGPLRLFRFLSFRSVGGAATALGLGILFAPWMIARLRDVKAAQTFRDASEIGKLAELHEGKKGTPTMGGLIIYFSVVISTLLWADWNIFVFTALLVYTGLTIIGGWDDYLKISRRHSGGLPGRYKLGGQGLLTVAALVLLLGHPDSATFIRQLWVPFLKVPILDPMPLALLGVFFFVVLAGSSNAINLTDGVDGLAIGCTLTVAMAFGLMAYATGNARYSEYLLLPFIPGAGELTVLCAILCAASLAFLWHNAHPAQVFMGDTGSLALGGLIGTVAVMILQPFTLVIIGGVFVLEALSVIIQVSSYKSIRPKSRPHTAVHAVSAAAWIRLVSVAGSRAGVT